ncbi:DUF397 domain-containing protein [Umezawaea sp. Da 62-37]|uniref:DUF397 domain-containing protein n=1 Tax=Umezawaea sp. Da 62-37 TaxID=3075927 RepID=UPI0028F7157B|nr:DUF397 domain-containing protein [Umezawaea sp. Da 62-37]WNV84402.1 DUF397 domain-containing protein [Umezawaea sp. Da 62-37]
MTKALTWRKSSYSGEGQSDCVEIAHSQSEVLVRDSKNTAGPALAFPAVQWQTFLATLD